MPNCLTAVGTSVAAYATSADLFANTPGRILERPSVVELGICGSATGLQVTFMIGSRVVVQDMAIGAQNRFPIDPDDTLIRAPGVRGEQISCTLRNTTAGALTANTVIKISPVG